MAQKVVKRKNRTKAHYAKRDGLSALVAQVDASAKASDGIADFGAGDTVRVFVKIKEGDKERLQAYEGLCIAMSNTAGSRSFTVRKMSHGVGVERIFLFNSPKVGRVEIVSPGRVRRSKLYYIRELQGRAARIERDMDAESAGAEAAAAPATPAAKS